MKKSHLNLMPTGGKEVTFEDLYDEISSDWQNKARKLQIRRNRAMKQAVRDGRY